MGRGSPDPPPGKPIRMAAKLKAESMKRYGRPAEEVETAFLKIMDAMCEEAEEDGRGYVDYDGATSNGMGNRRKYKG